MLRDLYAQGFNYSEIARNTGFDRKTVSTHLKSKTPPETKKRPNKESKLDKYKDYIIEKLNEGPYTAARLFREITEMGFTGQYTIVKDFIRENRPKHGVQAVYRYETKPGLQAQVDWSELGRVEIDGTVKKLYCFNMILGYSRMRYIEFTLSIDVITLIKCHINAFQYFGGIPKEILYDNMKQVVIKRARSFEMSEVQNVTKKFNGKIKDLLDFAALYVGHAGKPDHKHLIICCDIFSPVTYEKYNRNRICRFMDGGHPSSAPLPSLLACTLPGCPSCSASARALGGVAGAK